METESGSLVCLSRTLALGRILGPIEATCGLRRANEERRLTPQFGLYVPIPSQSPTVTPPPPRYGCKRTSELGLAASPPPHKQSIHPHNLPVPIGVVVRGERRHGHEDGHIPEPRVLAEG